MKILTLTALTLTSFIFYPAANAKTIATKTVAAATVVAEPDIYDVVYYVNPASGKFDQLERQQAMTQGKIKAWGIGGVTQGIEVPGVSSSVILDAKTNHEFVVKLMDISDTKGYSLYKFEPNTANNSRYRFLQKMSSFSAPKMQAASPFDIGKYGNSSAKFFITNDFQPGQYCFIASALSQPTQDLSAVILATTNKAFCFALS